MSGTTNIPIVSIVLRKQGKILFILRSNTGWNDGFYGLPAGHVDPGENFSQAICREAKEELGITVKPEDLKHILTFHQKASSGDVRMGVYFETTKWTGEPYNAEPHKHGEIKWFDENNLPATIVRTTARKLEAIKNGVHYLEYGWED